MVKRCLLAACLALVFVTPQLSRAQADSPAAAIPEFTPNVVDPAHSLSGEDVAAINANFEQIRARSDIWGAVYLTQSLDGQTIEQVSEQAFKKWQLGQKGKDNGLLLVLALDEHKSRFEVGYGLEGDLPDVIARQVLDTDVRENMRAGNTRNAIIASFNRLADVRLHTPGVADELKNRAKKNTADSIHVQNNPLLPFGLFSTGLYLVFLWFTGTMVRSYGRKRAAVIEQELPKYKAELDTYIYPKEEFRFALGRFGLRLFLTLNPGIFVFLISLTSIEGASIVAVLCAAIGGGYLFFATRRYRSAPAYQAYADQRRKWMGPFAEAGFETEVTLGVYEKNKAMFGKVVRTITKDGHTMTISEGGSSSSFGGSSSSSNWGSSGGSSSSSGGGSSGGGGASSSW